MAIRMLTRLKTLGLIEKCIKKTQQNSFASLWICKTGFNDVIKLYSQIKNLIENFRSAKS